MPDKPLGTSDEFIEFRQENNVRFDQKQIS